MLSLVSERRSPSLALWHNLLTLSVCNTTVTKINLPTSTQAAKREVRWSCKKWTRAADLSATEGGGVFPQQHEVALRKRCLVREKKKQGLGVGEGERTWREKTPFRVPCATITVKSNKAEIRFAYLSSACDYTSFCLQPQELTEPQRNTDAPNKEKMAFMQISYTISPHLAKLQPNASAVFRGSLKWINMPLLTCSSLVVAKKQMHLLSDSCGVMTLTTH